MVIPHPGSLPSALQHCLESAGCLLHWTAFPDKVVPSLVRRQLNWNLLDISPYSLPSFSWLKVGCISESDLLVHPIDFPFPRDLTGPWCGLSRLRLQPFQSSQIIAYSSILLTERYHWNMFYGFFPSHSWNQCHLIVGGEWFLRYLISQI